MLDVAKVEAEIDKLFTQAAKLNAETSKLHAETLKLHREARWYPLLTLAALLTAFAALFKSFH